MSNSAAENSRVTSLGPGVAAVPSMAADSGAFLLTPAAEAAHHFLLGLCPPPPNLESKATARRAYLTNVERSFISEREGHSKVV